MSLGSFDGGVMVNIFGRPRAVGTDVKNASKAYKDETSGRARKRRTSTNSEITASRKFHELVCNSFDSKEKRLTENKIPCLKFRHQSILSGRLYFAKWYSST